MHPDKLGRYRIVGVLGRGGMGVVYEGHDPQIDRPVAIKTIALDALDEREKALFEVRFGAEMRSTGRLQHHNIAALYDTGRDGGTAYIVMERVAGHDLKWHLAAGERFSMQQAIAITLQLLAALDYAHRRQVIHRDVKPANVMLQGDGVVKLCDFGVARLADADATRTQGMVVGSLRYASPEQILGHEIDARTDVFSAGVLLFELLTGTLPFNGKSDVEILHRISCDPAPSPRALNPAVPVEIDAAVRQAMAKNPDERFGSAAEFAQALGDSTLAMAGNLQPVPPPASAGLQPAASALVRGRGPWWWAAGGAVLLAAIGAWALLRPAPATVAPARPSPALTPAVSASAASMPAPADAVTSAVAPTPAPALPPPGAAQRLPAEGIWRGQLACGPLLSRPDGPGNSSFTAELEIHVEGQRIRWTRHSALVSETVDGSFDAQGRFSAEGRGARMDRAETWLEQASGAFVPATRRIEGHVQFLRPKDRGVARECTVVARIGSPAGAQALPASSASSPATRPQNLTAMQGAWRGRLACGASQSANVPPAIAAAYVADLTIEISGSRITMFREQASLSEKAVGDVDAQGRFKANGEGAFKERKGSWVVQASGDYLPKAGRIEGRMQLLRMSDRGLARECSLVAVRR